MSSVVIHTQTTRVFTSRANFQTPFTMHYQAGGVASSYSLTRGQKIACIAAGVFGVFPLFYLAAYFKSRHVKRVLVPAYGSNLLFIAPPRVKAHRPIALFRPRSWFTPRVRPRPVTVVTPAVVRRNRFWSNPFARMGRPFNTPARVLRRNTLSTRVVAGVRGLGVPARVVPAAPARARIALVNRGVPARLVPAAPARAMGVPARVANPRMVGGREIPGHGRRR